MKIPAALLTTSLLASGCNWSPSGPTPVVPFEDIRAQFEAGQTRLIAYGYAPRRILSVDVHDITWIANDGPFMCGSTWAWGCTSNKGRTIKFDLNVLRVIVHETCHAVLRLSGHGKHESHCVEHWGSTLDAYKDCPESERRVLGE